MRWTLQHHICSKANSGKQEDKLKLHDERTKTNPNLEMDREKKK